MDKPQRNRFRLNSNAVANINNNRLAGGQTRNNNNYDLVAIQIGQNQNQYLSSQNISQKGNGSYSGKNGSSLRTIPKKNIKYNSNQKQAQSARKKKNEPEFYDDRVQTISSNQFQQQRYLMTSQSNLPSQPQQTISALNFSPSKVESIIPPTDSVHLIINAYDEGISDELDAQQLTSIVSLKKARRKEKMVRRLEVIRAKEKLQQKKTTVEQKQNYDQNNVISVNLPILKAKANLSPEVVTRRDLQLNQGATSNDYILKKQNTGKSRKQVSISVQSQVDDELKSPQLGSRKDRNQKRMVKGKSNDSLTLLKLPGQQKQQNSDFTISSNDNIGAEAQENDEGNSIISEEDSAFEDQTPMVQKQRKRSSQMWEQRENTAIDKRPQLEDNQPQQIKEYKRQKTVGWKGQQDTNKWPYRRSPTNKSSAAKARQNSYESGNIKRFKINKVDAKNSELSKNKNKYLEIRNRSGSKYRHKNGVGGGSRHSSLNYISDAMVDQLSMNFGKKYGQKQQQYENNIQDTNSVVSILTKGGTVMNPFNRDQQSQQNRNLSIYHTNIKKSRHHQSNTQLNDKKNYQKMEVASGERSIERNKKKQIASKTNVQFEMKLDDSYSLRDLRNSLQSTNKNMIKVYLKTPYKVLSIKDVNKKLNGKNSRDQLFQAENLLQIHTEFRNQGPQNQYNIGTHQKFKRQKSLVGIDKTQINTLGNTKSSMIQQVSSQSQLSETKGSAYFDESHLHQIKPAQGQEVRIAAGGGLELDSQVPMNNSIYATESQKLGSIQARHQRNQQAILENEYKQHFYDNLREQMIRRINQVNFQTNIYLKQQKLYSIYGTSSNPRELKQNLAYSDSKNQRIFEQVDRQSIQEMQDSSFRDKNFSISPELTNYELNNLRIQQLNIDSRDSLIPTEAHQLAAKTFDNKASKHNTYVQQSENDRTYLETLPNQQTEQNVDSNYKYQTMRSNENLHNTEPDDNQSNMRDQLRQLLEQSGSMNYPNNLQRELKQLENTLIYAERQLEVQLRRRDLHRQHQAKDGTRSYSPEKYNLPHRESKHANILSKDQKTYLKNQGNIYVQPSSNGFLKSHPKHMDSYQETIKKKGNIKATKEYIDQSSYDGERSIDINQSNPNIQLNFSSVKDANVSNPHIREQNWRSIDSSVDVKDYFENKISMRRSIDKKLHYDHIRNQAHNQQHQTLRKHQKILERKIFYQSQKMRQMAQNANNLQVESVNIYDGTTNVPGKATMSSMKEQVNSIMATKRHSNNGSSFTADKASNVITPIKNQNGKQSRNAIAAVNTIGHSQAYQNILPMMPNVEDYMKNSPSFQKKKQNGKGALETATVPTHLPQIKSTSTTTSQPYLSGQKSQKFNPMVDTRTLKQKKVKQMGLNVIQQDQSLLKSPRSSYGDLMQENGTTAKTLNQSNNLDDIKDEDLNTHLEKSGISLKKQSYKLERIQNQKFTSQINSSNQVNKGRLNVAYRNQREYKQLSMPHLKEEMFMPHDKFTLKKSKYNTPAYNLVQVQQENSATPQTTDQYQKKLGFQFKNKSPRFIPPGALREFSYTNPEHDGSSAQKQQNIDYMDNEYLIDNAQSNMGGMEGVDNNYQRQKFPTINQSGKIFATSGPAIVSPSNLQSLSNIKNKNFNKNQHLMKGVLTQQRRFSRIVSNKQNKKLKLDLSNSDLHQLFINQQRGRNSMASSLPAKIAQANQQNHYHRSAISRNENDQNTALQIDLQSNDQTLNDAENQIDSGSQTRINTHPASSKDRLQDHLNGPVM